MVSDAEQTSLPGFETIAPVLAKASAFRSLEETAYTAEEVYLKHRERYEIAAFLANCGLGLSDRFVCKACKLNVRTLKAIKMREDGKESAAALFKRRVRGFTRVIKFNVMQEVYERLNDPGTLASLSIGDLAKAKALADEFAKDASGNDQADETVIDVDADAFDDALAENRFLAEKSGAAEADGQSAASPSIDPSEEPSEESSDAPSEAEKVAPRQCDRDISPNR